MAGARHGGCLGDRASVWDVTLLSEEEINTALGTLRGWARSGASITSTVELADFREAMLFTGAVAYMAEAANHHPDILIQWNRVTLTLSTHSEGGGADQHPEVTPAPGIFVWGGATPQSGATRETKILACHGRTALVIHNAIDQ